MSDDSVLYNVIDGVATLTLNRPDARNALDVSMMVRAIKLLNDAASDPKVRVIVLTGAGTVFCAGADLRSAAADEGAGFQGNATEVLAQLLAALQDNAKPSIARIQGHVAGGENGLVAACDLAVAVESARFAFSEVRVGVAPAVISVVCLPRMRPRDAAELLLTGERVSAERARESGLINAVVPDEALDGYVGGWVEQLMAGGPRAVAATKQLLREVPARDRDDAFTYTAALSAQLFASDEAREGMTAFIERRAAVWPSVGAS